EDRFLKKLPNGFMKALWPALNVIAGDGPHFHDPIPDPPAPDDGVHPLLIHEREHRGLLIATKCPKFSNQIPLGLIDPPGSKPLDVLGRRAVDPNHWSSPPRRSRRYGREAGPDRKSTRLNS